MVFVSFINHHETISCWKMLKFCGSRQTAEIFSMPKCCMQWMAAIRGLLNLYLTMYLKYPLHGFLGFWKCQWQWLSWAPFVSFRVVKSCKIKSDCFNAIWALMGLGRISIGGTVPKCSSWWYDRFTKPLYWIQVCAPEPIVLNGVYYITLINVQNKRVSGVNPICRIHSPIYNW